MKTGESSGIMRMDVVTKSREETFEIGRQYGENAKAGQVYALIGDLGAGKTVWAKGFAAGLGVKDAVSSPTFTILQTYEDGRLTLHHFDVYRLEDPDEMAEIGFDEWIDGDGVSLIEWADLIRDLLPDETIRVTIQRVPGGGPDERQIMITG